MFNTPHADAHANATDGTFPSGAACGSAAGTTSAYIIGDLRPLDWLQIPSTGDLSLPAKSHCVTLNWFMQNLFVSRASV